VEFGTSVSIPSAVRIVDERMLMLVTVPTI